MTNYLIVERPEPVGIAVLSSVRDFLQKSFLVHKNFIKGWRIGDTVAEANSEDRRPPSLLLTCKVCEDPINPVTATSRSNVCRFV